MAKTPPSRQLRNALMQRELVFWSDKAATVAGK